jgi:predicted RNase H-like HicB family nuclease
MKTLKYIIYKEGKHFVSQCLNVEVASFGDSVEEATKNLKEALDLYFEDDLAKLKYRKIQQTLVGELNIRF